MPVAIEMKLKKKNKTRISTLRKVTAILIMSTTTMPQSDLTKADDATIVETDADLKPPRLHRSMAMEPEYCGKGGCPNPTIGSGFCELHCGCNGCIEYRKETLV